MRGTAVFETAVPHILTQRILLQKANSANIDVLNTVLCPKKKIAEKLVHKAGRSSHYKVKIL
jgi:hypothetical protein